MASDNVVVYFSGSFRRTEKNVFVDVRISVEAASRLFNLVGYGYGISKERG